MTATLPSGLRVSALVRRVNDAGGSGMVRARGEAESGGILLILSERGAPRQLLEQARDPAGTLILRSAGPPAPLTEPVAEAYWRRRRAGDPDLWVVELDIASAERFAAETICGD